MAEVAQMSPVFMDREVTIEKTVVAMEEAARSKPSPEAQYRIIV